MVKKTAVTERSSKESGSSLEVRSAFFFIGPWKELVRDHYKLLIASALNFCTCYHGLKVAGYLISDEQLVLALIVRDEDFQKQIHEINRCLRIELIRFCDELNLLSAKHDETDSLKRDDLFTSPMLKPFYTADRKLIALLTGEKVTSVYFDPHLEKLKATLQGYLFSSLIDHSGALGPVIVTPFHSPEKQSRLKLNHRELSTEDL